MHSVVPSTKTYTSSVPSGPGRTSVSSTCPAASSSSTARVRSWSLITGEGLGTKSGCEGWRRRAAASSADSPAGSSASATGSRRRR
ncbi:hypothetical protein SFUMM280S_07275 [Streptomyces fumanus]